MKGINILSDTIIHSPSDGDIIEIVIDTSDKDEYWIICNTTDICYIDFTDNLLAVLASVSVILAGLAAVEYVKRKSNNDT